MKERIALLVMFIGTIFIVPNLYGQEKKNSVAINVSMAHYVNIDDFQKQSYDSYESSFNYPISPGLEFEFQRQLSNRLELGSGISFQTSLFKSQVNITYHKFQCIEISIPVVIRKYFSSKNDNRLFTSLGAYNGLQVGVASQIPQSVGWTLVKDIRKIAGYSNDRFFTDIYAELGYYRAINQNDGISVLSFVNYRVNTTWLNTYQERIHWGIKFSYQFKI